MSPGAALYLVSACGSAEEFVAAFRRYADRTGLFVPTATPLPAGRRGRIAVTLKDGGVMIEGEAEILQSSAKPTVLQGRPGMTIKFVEPDEPSKVVITELEKARLAMRPPPPTVPPRPANIPAEPRPTPPAPGGRIDASNALAECVVIGDVTSLRDTANAPRAAGDAGSGKAKFVVPSIPRPNSPSQAGSERAKPSTVPPPVPALPTNSNPKLTSIGFPALKPPAPDSGKLLQTLPGTQPPANPTQEMPALLQTKLGVGAPKPSEAPVASDEETTAIGAVPVRPAVLTDDEATSIGQVPAKPATAGKLTMGWDAVGEPEPAAPEPTPAAKSGGVSSGVPAAASSAKSGGVTKSGSVRSSTEIGSGIVERPAAPPPSGNVSSGVPQADPAKPPPTPASAKNQRMTSIGFPAMSRTPFETQAVGVVPPPKDPEAPVVGTKPAKPVQPRRKTPTSPPSGPRHPTPAAPLPVVRLPAKGAPPIALHADEDETTDLSSVPVAASAPLPPETPVPQVDPLGKTESMPVRSGGMRASEIMAAIGAEDWTMTPDAPAPTVLTPADKAPIVESEPTPSPQEPPQGPPTGNWTISLDPETGWSAPEKVPAVVPPPAPPELPKRKPTAGNPSLAIASDKAINAVEWEEKPTGIGEAKIEIDPTLMQPHKPMPVLDDDEPESAPLAAPPPAPPRDFGPPPLPQQQLFAPPMPPPPGAFATGPGMLQLPTPAVGPAAPSKKRLIVIGICAAAVVALVAIVLAGGDKEPKQTAATNEGSGSAAIVTPPSVVPVDAAVVEEQQVVVEQGSGSGSAVVETPPPPPPVASGPCKVDVNSVPTGADILVAKKKVATAPSTIELPCGTESTVTVRKAKFVASSRSITPSAEKRNKVTIKLGKPMVSLKVTSIPAGATITIGGKSAGVTPTTVKVAGGAASTITLTKPGFAPDKSRVTAKANGQAHHVVLKKATRR